MKTILIMILGLFLSAALYADELGWVDEQIEAIKPPRKSAKISSIGSPFIFLEKNKTKKKDSKKPSFRTAGKMPSVTSKKVVCDTKPVESYKGFVLSTIINSSAMINGAWYKKDDKIKSYTIIDISKTSVTLKQGDKTLTLSTNTKTQNLKFKNK